MPDYQQGKIYKIISDKTDRIYIGSTTMPRLSTRMAGHRSAYKRWNNDKEANDYLSSFEMLQHDDAAIILIKAFPCNNKDELRAEEQVLIDERADICINKHRADTGIRAEFRNAYEKPKHENYAEVKTQSYNSQYAKDDREILRKKKYVEENKEKVVAYRKQYYLDNAEKIRIQHNEYGAANRDRAKQYREANKEKAKKYMKQYGEKNKEAKKLYMKKYTEANKERLVLANKQCRERKIAEKTITENQI